MKSGDRRCRPRIGRPRWEGLRSSGSDEGRRDGGPSDACCGKQLATTEFEVEFGVRWGHRGEVAPEVTPEVTPKCPPEPIANRRQSGKPASDRSDGFRAGEGAGRGDARGARS